ncbi:MAG: PBP1A family penicillin-binding protein [Patescibacteria group bacterium]
MNKLARVAIILGGGLLVIGGLSFLLIVKDLPSPDILNSRQVFESTKIYDRTGEFLLYEIHGEEKRTIIPFEKIPDHVKQATIAIEDANFYKHSAFDIKSIIRAFLVNLTRGRISQGGSTITQQLAKNAFLTPKRTITRKVKELVLAIRLENQFSKDEILNLYLNQIPYGANAYGIEAASQTYFQKHAENLNLAEAALLASLPKAPSYYSPWSTHVQDLMDRKNLVLEKMVELNYIDEKTKKIAQNYKFEFAPKFTSIKAPHFVIAVQDYLNKRYGEDFVRTAGLKVTTTVDWKLQELAEKAVADGAQRNEELYQGKNAALVAQDASTGQVLALVGSKNYFDANDGNFNVATQGLRQPGSTIKPFAYLAAFQKGFTPETVVFDLETEFDATEIPENSYKPQNFDEKFRGPVTLRKALAQSINIPSIKTLYLAGIDAVLRLTKDFGITTLTERSRYGLSLVLGGGEVKLIDLVNAYSVLAQEGIKHKQSLILKVIQDDKILEEYEDDPQKVIEPQYTRLINDILSDVESRAPLFSNSLGLTVFPNQEVALKTGTTNDYRDAWAVGYTPTFVVGVWAGNNDNTPMQKKGSSILAAIPIWNAFMSESLKGRVTETFNHPDPIFTDKPMLKGEYVINYSVGNQNFPQIHDILFYVDKDDPLGPAPKNPERDSQYLNWDEPVQEWVKTNLSNLGNVNQLLPINAQIIGENQEIKINLIWPENGGFIKNPVEITADIKSGINLKSVEIYFNEILLDRVINLGSNYYIYRKNISLENVKTQNKFKISVLNESNIRSEKEIILYK